jgi:carbamate kinase
MLVVVAVGGNALLERGETPSADIQERHVDEALRSLAPLAHDHDIVITHGNGPQIGLLANESALDPDLPAPYPLDVLGAQTQGMIGYFFLRALGNALPGRQIVSLICQTVVAADDPAFRHPTKFVGPIYEKGAAQRLAKARGWTVRSDGASWRRVVPSPEPLVIVELAAIRALVGDAAIVICSGGGGIPVARDEDGHLYGVEAVIDKDLAAALLARDLRADALVILTDVANVELGFGTNAAQAIGRTTAAMLRRQSFADGSMGPKVEAACRFVEDTGRPAMIGRLGDVADLLAQRRGTIVEPVTAIGATRPMAVLQRGSSCGSHGDSSPGGFIESS